MKIELNSMPIQTNKIPVEELIKKAMQRSEGL
jgi:hypothetical protein